MGQRCELTRSAPARPPPLFPLPSHHSPSPLPSQCGMRALASGSVQCCAALLAELNNVLGNTLRDALASRLAPGPARLLAVAPGLDRSAGACEGGDSLDMIGREEGEKERWGAWARARVSGASRWCGALPGLCGPGLPLTSS
jgi:hypothetical protein